MVELQLLSTEISYGKSQETRFLDAILGNLQYLHFSLHRRIVFPEKTKHCLRKSKSTAK